MAQPKKTNARILARDVYEYISRNSSLTPNQVKECFHTYRQMIVGLLESKYRDDDLTIAFPKMGLFYFSEVKGRKKGSTYKMPIDFGSKEMKTVTLTEDEPNYHRLKFKVSRSFNTLLKESSGRRA